MTPLMVDVRSGTTANADRTAVSAASPAAGAEQAAHGQIAGAQGDRTAFAAVGGVGSDDGTG